MLMANVHPTCETNIIRYPSKIPHYMLQQSTMNTRKNHPGQKKQQLYPNCLVPSTKKPEVFKFQLPSIKQVYRYIHSMFFPPRVLGQKVGSVCLKTNIVSNPMGRTVRYVYLPTFFSVFLFYGNPRAGSLICKFSLFHAFFPHGSKFGPAQGSCAWRDCFCNDQHELSGPVLDHSSSLDTPGGLDHWIVGLGFAICLRCLGPK